MREIIRVKDLVVGQYYKTKYDRIFKVHHLDWHKDGMHKGKINSLILLCKDGSKKRFSFLPADTPTHFNAVVDGFELDEQEKEIKRLREALKFYANDDHWLPTNLIPFGIEEYRSDIELDGGRLALQALEVAE